MLAIQRALDPFARHRLKAFDCNQLDVLFLGRRKDRCDKRMFASLFEAGRCLQQLGVLYPFGRNRFRQLRLAFSQRAGLIDNKRVYFLQDFESLSIADKNSFPGSPSRVDHDRHGRCQTEGARARNDEYGNCVDQRMRIVRLRSVDRPHCKSNDCGQQYCRHKV